MERYLLFVRDIGRDDETDIHPSKAAARKALAAYVRKRSPDLKPLELLDDEAAITTYLSRDEADYVIARGKKPSMRGEGLA